MATRPQLPITRHNRTSFDASPALAAVAPTTAALVWISTVSAAYWIASANLPAARHRTGDARCRTRR